MRRNFWLAVAAGIAVFPASGLCQQQEQQNSSPPAQPAAKQEDSLAAAARRTKEQRKDTSKSVKVFDNDNLPTIGGISTVGNDSAPGAAAAGDAAGGTAPAAGAKSASNDEKSWRKKFADLRQKLAMDQQDLDVMQRELGVLDIQNYSDPMKGMQQSLTRSDINAKTAAIEAKKKQITADQQAISDAEDELRKSGGDSGWAR
jgi:hypothetical protein